MTPLPDPVVVLTSGGVFSYAVPLCGCLGIIIGLVLAWLGATRYRLPAVLFVVFPCLTLTLGSVGAIMDFQSGLPFVALETDENDACLRMAAVLGYTLYNTGLATLLAAMGFLTGAWLIALTQFVRPGGRAETIPVHAAVPAALALLGAIPIALFGGFGGAAIAVCGGLAIALASVRVPRVEQDEQRIAAGRAAVAALCVLAALFSALYDVEWGRSLVHSAMSSASAETRQILLAGTDLSHLFTGRGPLMAAGVLFFSGLASVFPLARHLGNRRSIRSGLALVAVVLVPTATVGTLEATIAPAIDQVRPWINGVDLRLVQLKEMGIELPRGTAWHRAKHELRVTVGLDKISFEGEDLGSLADAKRQDGMIWPLFERLDKTMVDAIALGSKTGDDFITVIDLEADARLTLGQLGDVLRSGVGARFSRLNIVVQRADRRAITMAMVASEPRPSADMPPESTDPVVQPDLEEDPLGLWLKVESGAVELGASRADYSAKAATAAGLLPALTGIKDRYAEVETIDFYPGHTATLAQLVEAMDTCRADPNDKSDGRPRLLFPYVTLHLGGQPQTKR